MTPNLDSFNGYDRFTNRYGSPYQTSNNTLNVSSNDIFENNRKIEQQYNLIQCLRQMFLQNYQL